MSRLLSSDLKSGVYIPDIGPTFICEVATPVFVSCLMTESHPVTDICERYVEMLKPMNDYIKYYLARSYIHIIDRILMEEECLNVMTTIGQRMVVAFEFLLSRISSCPVSGTATAVDYECGNLLASYAHLGLSDSAAAKMLNSLNSVILEAKRDCGKQFVTSDAPATSVVWRMEEPVPLPIGCCPNLLSSSADLTQLSIVHPQD